MTEYYVRCGAQLHKACTCVRPQGHDGQHNCTFPREHAPTPAEVAAKQLKKMQWQLLEAALFALYAELFRAILAEPQVRRG